MEQTERDLSEQAARLITREEFIAWEQCRDDFIKSLDEQTRTCAIIDWCEIIVGRTYHATRKFERIGARTFHASGRRIYSAGLRWREIDTAFESRIMTGAVINFKHIELRQLLKDAREIVLMCEPFYQT